MRRLILGVMLTGLALVPAMTAAADLDATLKAISAKLEQLESVSGQIDGTIDISSGGEGGMSLLATGTLDAMKKDGKLKARVSLDIRPPLMPPDQKAAGVEAALNGDSVEYQVSMFGHTTSDAYAVPAAMAQSLSQDMLLGLLKQHFALSALPDSEIDGKPVYALAGKPQFAMPSDIAAADATAYFDKASGMLVKLDIEAEMQGASNPSAAVIQIRDIVLNPPLSESTFVLPDLPEPAPKPQAPKPRPTTPKPPAKPTVENSPVAAPPAPPEAE